MPTNQLAVLASIHNLTHIIIIDQDSVSPKQIIIQAQNHVTVATATLSSILIATCDNKLWEVPGSALRSTNAHRYDEDASPNYQQKEQQMEEDDIFGELLKNECAIRERNILPPNESDIIVIDLKPEHLLLSEEKTILDMAATADVVVILYDMNGLLELSIFELVEQDFMNLSVQRNRASHLQNISTGMKTALIKGRSRDTLPRKTRHLFFLQLESQIDENTHQSSTSIIQVTLPSGVLSMPLSLFTSVFGKQAACLNSPIILLCYGGHVFGHAIKSLIDSSKNRLKVICQMNSDIIGILPVSTKNECKNPATDDQEAIAALSAALGKDLPINKQDVNNYCLTVLTVTGDGCLFMSPPDGTDGPLILKFSLPHPIAACTVFKDLIVYSTGRSVELCRLTLSQRSEEKNVCVIPLMQTLLGKARIQELHPFSFTTRLEGSTITGITYDFEMVSISVIWTEDNTTDSSGVTSSYSLDETLHNIEQCYKKIELAKKDSEGIDFFLHQISIFASLVHSLTELNEPEEFKQKQNFLTEFSQSSITCQCSILAIPHLYSYNWALAVRLKNDTGTVLSEDWAIIVTLCSKCGNSVCGHPDFNKNYNFPLSRGLRSSAEIEVHIPLNDFVSIDPVSVLEVSLSLVLKLRKVHDLLTICSPLSKGVTVKIHKQQFDILYFLHRADDQSLQVQSHDGSGSSQGQNSGTRHLYKELQKMAHKRIGVVDISERDSSCLTTRIGVLKSVCESLTLHNPTDVLLFILKDIDIPIAAINSPTCQLQDPHGSVIAITVSTIPADLINAKSSAVSDHLFVITLRGTSVHFLYQSSAAIRSRLRFNSGAKHAQVKSTEELQRQFTQLQRVREGIVKAQEKLESLSMSEGESGKVLCEVMEKPDMLPKQN